VKALRFLFATMVAGLLVPYFGGALQEGAIGLKNGHAFAWATAFLTNLGAMPFFLLGGIVMIPAAMLVAAFSLGLESLIGRRSILIWLAHGAIMGWLELIWLRAAHGPALIIYGMTGAWLIASSLMWLLLSCRHLDNKPFGSILFGDRVGG
jgi:hypothetical protein